MYLSGGRKGRQGFSVFLTQPKVFTYSCMFSSSIRNTWTKEKSNKQGNQSSIALTKPFTRATTSLWNGARRAALQQQVQSYCTEANFSWDSLVLVVAPGNSWGSARFKGDCILAKGACCFPKVSMRMSKTGDNDTGIQNQCLTTRETDHSNIWVPQVGDKSMVFLCD